MEKRKLFNTSWKDVKLSSLKHEMGKMTAEERLDIMSPFCHKCGNTYIGCACAVEKNDEVE